MISSIPRNSARIAATGVNRVVLVVDDSAEVLRLVANALDFAYDVILVSSPSSVLQLVDEVQVDVLITDIRMPEMDGMDLVDRLRARNPEMPVVFMSGYMDQQTRAEAERRSGHVIGKPFRILQLRECVRLALGEDTAPPTEPIHKPVTQVRVERAEEAGILPGDLLKLAQADPLQFGSGSLVYFQDGADRRVGRFSRHAGRPEAPQAELRADGRTLLVSWEQIVGQVEEIERDGQSVPLRVAPRPLWSRIKAALYRTRR